MDDQVVFVFDGGTMSRDDMAAISLRDNEIDRWKFIDVEDVCKEMHQHIWSRLRAAADSVISGSTTYLEREPPRKVV